MEDSMSKSTANPMIARPLRIVYGITTIVIVAGAALFFFPGFMVPLWPWPLTPFNARFLGSVYLLELSALIIMMISNRWAPARLILPLSFFFSTIVTLVSLFYIDRFNFGKLSTYVWFLLYTVAAVALTYYMWYYRNTPPADPTPPPPAWRSYFLVEGAIYGLYGVGLMILPSTFSSFWPWAIDDFHARIYSTVFLLLPVAMWVLYHAAAPIEFFTMSVTQIVLSVFAVLGVVIVDLSVHRVNWAALGTWIWVSGFAVLFVSGLGLLNHALSRGLFRSPVVQPVAIQSHLDQ